MKIWKRAASVGLSLALCAGMVMPSFAAVDLQEYINNYDPNASKGGFIALEAVDGDNVFTMNDDVTTNKTLTVAAGSEIILEMNGHTLTHENNNNQVFRVSGTLEVDAEEGGVITGGNGVNVKGGAVSVTGEGSSFKMKGGEISDNNAEHGGAIFAALGATVDIEGTVIKDNTAKNRIGGAIYALNADVKLKNVTLEGNTAAGNGAALGIEITGTGSGSLEMENCTVQDGDGTVSAIELKKVVDQDGVASGTLTATLLANHESQWVDTASGITLSIAKDGTATITKADGNPVDAICDADGRLIENGTAVKTADGKLAISFRMATEADYPLAPPEEEPSVTPDEPDDFEFITADTEINEPAVPLASGPVTRAEFIDYLWRHEGEPETDGVCTFTDVPEDHEYVLALAWAEQNGVAEANKDGTFEPDELVTVAAVREFLGNFAEVFGMDVDVYLLSTLTGDEDEAVLNCDEVIAEFFGEELADQAA